MPSDPSIDAKDLSKFKFIKTQKVKTDLRKEEPPLVDLKVSNPVTYIKSWWKKIIGNEGIEFRLIVKPLTAIAITVIVVTIAFGIGKFVFPFKIPFFEYSSKYEPTPTPDLTRETAFTGILRKSSIEKYYLQVESSEAVTLEVPENIDLEELLGKRILASGKFNPINRVLVVSNIEGLEILSNSPSPIPTVSPSPSPTVLIPQETPQPPSTSSASQN